jgi:hypothetical protein
MKFLAILRDSYREAVSGWVLQAMMVLAGLLMIFVAGLSFRPLSPEEIVSQPFRIWTLVFRNDPNAGKPNYSVENFVQLNAPAPLREGDYKFDLVLKTPSADDLKKVEGIGLPHDEKTFRRVVKETAPFLKDVTTTTLGGAPGEVRVEFRTQGTTIEDPLAWPTEPNIFFAIPSGPFFWMSLRQAIYRVEKTMVNDLGAWAAMLISVIVTAGFIPNMLRKGALDLYVAKPIGPVQLLLYKYVGGLTFVFLLAAFTIGGIWLVIGLRTGIWTPTFLLEIPILTFYFAILYAVSTLVGVLTRSSLVAILVTVLVWGLIYGVGLGHEAAELANQTSQQQFVQVKKMQGQEGVNPDEMKSVRVVPGFVETGLYVLRKCLPRTYDLDKLSGRLIAKSVLTKDELKQKGYDKPLAVTWGEVIFVSGLWIAALLALASWRLVTRDG